MQKRKILTMGILMLITISLSGCGKNKVENSVENNNFGKEQVEAINSKDLSTKEYKVENFEKIYVQSPVDVYYTVGEKISVKAEVNEYFLENLVIEVENNELKIYCKDNLKESMLNMRDYPNVYITAPKINALALSGASSFQSEDTIVSDSFNVGLSGASSSNLPLKAKDLTVEISGNSDCKFSGEVQNLNCRLSGSSNMNFFELQTNNSKVIASGASHLEISCKDNLDVSASGASSVLYKGNPKVMKNLSGASTVEREN